MQQFQDFTVSIARQGWCAKPEVTGTGTSIDA